MAPHLLHFNRPINHRRPQRPSVSSPAGRRAVYRHYLCLYLGQVISFRRNFRWRRRPVEHSSRANKSSGQRARIALTVDIDQSVVVFGRLIWLALMRQLARTSPRSWPAPRVPISRRCRFCACISGGRQLVPRCSHLRPCRQTFARAVATKVGGHGSRIADRKSLALERGQGGGISAASR